MAPPTDPSLDTPGLASGPGPTPPGFDDGTPRSDRVEPGDPEAAEKQRQAGEVAERSAGTRQGEIAEDAGGGQPEEQQPDEG